MEPGARCSPAEGRPRDSGFQAIWRPESGLRRKLQWPSRVSRAPVKAPFPPLGTPFKLRSGPSAERQLLPSKPEFARGARPPRRLRWPIAFLARGLRAKCPLDIALVSFSALRDYESSLTSHERKVQGSFSPEMQTSLRQGA
jgi:hypothetical protein